MTSDQPYYYCPIHIVLLPFVVS